MLEPELRLDEAFHMIPFRIFCQHPRLQWFATCPRCGGELTLRWEPFHRKNVLMHRMQPVTLKHDGTPTRYDPGCDFRAMATPDLFRRPE